MIRNNTSLQLEFKLDRWQHVALEKFLTSEANWIEPTEDTVKQVAENDIEQEQELRLSAQPFARIVASSEWRKTSYWDEVTVKVEFVTGLLLMTPGRSLAVPASYLQGLFRALGLFPEQMEKVEEVC